MAGGYGRRFDSAAGLGRVDRPVKPRTVGSYRSADRRGDGTGGTVYPTVLEAYNRDSDYKRWRAGWDYFQGSGKGWSDIERYYLVRSFRDYGSRSCGQLVSASYFPSASSPDGAWVVTCRRRGAIILPQLLRQADITLDTSHPSPEQHRLILDVSATLSSAQVQAWSAFIGDQFEDSATGPEFPSGLIAEPIDTIAYTLVEVDATARRLLFDLSRPYMRRRPDRSVPRAFWQKILYNRTLPLSWQNSGTRYLCSSHRLYCSCPDFSGARLANLNTISSGSQALFPRPAAGRSESGSWEAENTGYAARWRDLPERADQRRECKHIHAARWSISYPFYEPSDYMVGDSEQHFQDGAGGSITSPEVLRYHQLRELTLDRLAGALADSVGVMVDAKDTISPDENAPAQPGRRPVLWTSQREPAAHRAVADDWWIQRGTSVLRIFDPAVGRFVDSTLAGSAQQPVIELGVDAGAIISKLQQCRHAASTLALGIATAQAAPVATISAAAPSLGPPLRGVEILSYGAEDNLATATNDLYVGFRFVPTQNLTVVELATWNDDTATDFERLVALYDISDPAAAALVASTTIYRSGASSNYSYANGFCWTPVAATALQAGNLYVVASFCAAGSNFLTAMTAGQLTLLTVFQFDENAVSGQVPPESPPIDSYEVSPPYVLGNFGANLTVSS